MPDAFEDIRAHIKAVETEASERAAAAAEVKRQIDRAFDEAAAAVDVWLPDVLGDFASAFGLCGQIERRRTSDDAIVTQRWNWVAKDGRRGTRTRHPHSVTVLLWRRRPNLLKVRVSWSIGEHTVGKCVATREAVANVLRGMFTDPADFWSEESEQTF